MLGNSDLVSDYMESFLSSDYFDEIHKPILGAIEFSFGSNVLLTKDSFLDYLRNAGKNKLDIQNQELLYLRIYMMLSKLSKDDFPNLKQKIITSFLVSNTTAYIDEFVSAIKKSNPIDAVQKLASKMLDLTIESEEQKSVIYEDMKDYLPVYVDDLLNRSNSKEDTRILTHIREIDEVITVGLQPGNLILFSSDVAGYKTTMMLNIALNVWKYSNVNVLFVPLEMPRKLLTNKIASRETGIDSQKLAIPKCLSEEEKIKLQEFQDNWEKSGSGGKFYILEASDRVPVSLIKKEIKRHIEAFSPRLVIVDYIANLIPEKKYNNMRNDLQIGEMLKDLRTMGRENAITKDGFTIISGAQIGREGLKRTRRLGINKTSFYSEDLRGSHEYPADADAVFAQLPDEQNSNVLNIICIKSRYGPPVFLDGSRRTQLNVIPEISLIQSKDKWNTSDQSDIHDLTSSMPSVPEDEILDDDDDNDDENKTPVESYVQDEISDEFGL